jgi:hypothetical protein
LEGRLAAVFPPPDVRGVRLLTPTPYQPAIHFARLAWSYFSGNGTSFPVNFSNFRYSRLFLILRASKGEKVRLIG